MATESFRPDAIRFFYPGHAIVVPEVQQAALRNIIPHGGTESSRLRRELRDLIALAFGRTDGLSFALPLSGSGSADVVLNAFVEPSSRVVCLVNGVFSDRMRNVASRISNQVTVVEAPWGETIALPDLERTLKALDTVNIVTVVHGETSTGVLNPVEDIVQLVKRIRPDAFVLVDMVSTLGRVPLQIAGIDAGWVAAQKGLGGLANVSCLSLSPRAVKYFKDRVAAGTYNPPSWVLDLRLLLEFWVDNGPYHTTPSMPLLYALHEALKRLHEEHLEVACNRQALAHEAFTSAVEAMGLQLPIAAKYRLPTVVVVNMPEGVAPAAVIQTLESRHAIVVAGAMGEWATKSIRVGLLGQAYTEENINLIISALGDTISSVSGKPFDVQSGIATVKKVFSKQVAPKSSECALASV